MKKVLVFNPKNGRVDKIHDEEIFYPELMEEVVNRHARRKKKSKFKIVKGR